MMMQQELVALLSNVVDCARELVRLCDADDATDASFDAIRDLCIAVSGLHAYMDADYFDQSPEGRVRH